MKSTLCLLLSLAFCGLSIANDTSWRPLPFNLDVSAKTFSPIKASASGKMKANLCKKDNAQKWCYSVNTEVKMAAADNKSQVLIDEQNNVTSLGYQSNSRVLFSKTRKNIFFNQATNTGPFEARVYLNSKKYNHTKDAVLFDDMGFHWQLMLDASLGKETMSYQIIRHTSPRNTTFTRIGEEQLSTNFGTINTIKYMEGNAKGEVWLAPSLNYLPIQFTAFDGKKTKSTMTVKGGTLNGQPLNSFINQ